MEKEVSPERLSLAATNYIEALNLKPDAPVLFVTDHEGKNPNLIARRALISEMMNQLMGTNPLSIAHFQNDSSPRKKREELASAFGKLKIDPDFPLTVVIIGAEWKDRFEGLYQPLTALATQSNCRLHVATSYALGYEDINVISRIGSEEKKLLNIGLDYFRHAFKEDPQGGLVIQTYINDQSYQLNLSFDTSNAPAKADWGKLGTDNPNEITVGNIHFDDYINVPGEEIFLTPFPFADTYGSFAAENLVFTVENGFVTKATEGIAGAISKLSPGQKRAVEWINSKGPLPVSELGIGMLDLFDIAVPSKCSPTTREKKGLHIGVGKIPGSTTAIEAEVMMKKMGDFKEHVDFVLNTTKVHLGKSLFYPPIKFMFNTAPLGSPTPVWRSNLILKKWGDKWLD